MSINTTSLRNGQHNVPNESWVKVLKKCDEVTLDQVLRVSNCMLENVVNARREYWHEIFSRPKRWPNEALPTMLELKDRNCNDPRFENIRKTLQSHFLEQGPNGALSTFYEGATSFNKNRAQVSILCEETLTNGMIYRGGFKNGERDGFGILESSGILVYKGAFKNGLPDGYGIEYLDHHLSVVEGEFKEGKVHGQGKLRLANGNCYEGEFRDGQGNGQGKLRYPNGNCFEGEFRDGRLNGQGKLTRPSGDCYEGECRDNKPNGQGKVRLANGSCYEGEFVDGKLSGHGK